MAGDGGVGVPGEGQAAEEGEGLGLGGGPPAGDGGEGLLLGVELVKDRTSKEPVEARAMTAIVDFCRDNGVLVGRSVGGRRYSNTITMSPPLVITRAECDRIVDTLDRALSTVDFG